MTKCENHQGVDVGRIANGVDFDDPKSAVGYLALVNHIPLPSGYSQYFDSVPRPSEHSQSFDVNEGNLMQDNTEYSVK
nr:hypothetical protein [Candidatus Levybacteria bacterium]